MENFLTPKKETQKRDAPSLPLDFGVIHLWAYCKALGTISADEKEGLERQKNKASEEKDFQ